VKEGLEFVLAYSSESFSPSKLRRLSRRIRVNRTGFEDQCLFDGAFATKWVPTQGDVVARSNRTLTRIDVSLTGLLPRNGFNPGRRCHSLRREKESVFVLCQRLKGGFERLVRSPL
jgi:hypothetical protein